MSRERGSDSDAGLRPLADGERAILDRLLSDYFPGRDALLAQAHDVQVRPIDPDGSLVFVPDPDAPRAEVKRRIPVEAETNDLDGVVIHVLLHVINGCMNELEVYREDSARVVRPIIPEALRTTVL